MMEKKIIILVAIMIVGAIIIASSVTEEKKPAQEPSWYIGTDPWDIFEDENEYQPPPSSPTIPWAPTVVGTILIIAGIGGIIFLAKQSKESLPT